MILFVYFGCFKGQCVVEMSLELVGQLLVDLLGSEVCFVDDIVGDDVLFVIVDFNDGDVLLLQNICYEFGEEKNDLDFVQVLVDFGDIYVNDVFLVVY